MLIWKVDGDIYFMIVYLCYKLAVLKISTHITIMKLIPKCYLLAACLAVVTSGLVSCNHDDIYGGNGSGSDDNPALEEYMRAFIKEFGLFKAKPWSEAVSGAITVRTASPTPVNVFAEIDGYRFIFASLGAVNGVQPIVMNLPSEVQEVIVEAGDREYKVKLGSMLDLAKESRYHVENQYMTDMSDLFGNLTVTPLPDVYREIELTGSNFKEWVKRDHSFNIFDSYFNFYSGEGMGVAGYMPGENINPSLGHIHRRSSCFYPGSSESTLISTDVTVYPLYWRKNVYGENDYMLGFYYYSVTNDSDLPKIRMIDLDGLEVNKAVRIQPNGSGDFVVSSDEAAFVENDLKNPNRFRMKGYHIRIENIDKENRPRYGFYIKSGLKEGSTPEKGRNYTHITFQNAQYNATEWGDNYWNRPMKDVLASYTGAVLGSRTMVEYGRQKPIRVDGVAATDLGTNDVLYYPVGFMSQPNGRAADIDMDFCDVVIGVTLKDAVVGVSTQASSGETFGTYPWVLAAEDLGSTDDWDFNDVVFNVYDLTTDFTRVYTSPRAAYPTPTILGRRITVLPRAAGGTFPIYLMYQGKVADDITDNTMLSAIDGKFTDGTYVVGTELHAWLGEPDYKMMLNTGIGGEYDGCAVSFCVPIIGEDRLDFDIQNPPQDVGLANQMIRNFWVLVDKNDEMRGQLFNYDFDRTPIDPIYNVKDQAKIDRHVSQTKNVLKRFDGKLGVGAYRVNPPAENSDAAPQMLMCHYRWRWPVERANIGEVYDNFRAWVAGERTTWQGNPNLTLGESTNGYDPTRVCGKDDPIVWIQ